MIRKGKTRTGTSMIFELSRLKAKDFVVKTEPRSRTKRGQRVYLNDGKSRDLVKGLNGFFDTYIDVPRMRVGRKQTIE